MVATGHATVGPTVNGVVEFGGRLEQTQQRWLEGRKTRKRLPHRIDDLINHLTSRCWQRGAQRRRH